MMVIKHRYLLWLVSLKFFFPYFFEVSYEAWLLNNENARASPDFDR